MTLLSMWDLSLLHNLELSSLHEPFWMIIIPRKRIQLILALIWLHLAFLSGLLHAHVYLASLCVASVWLSHQKTRRRKIYVNFDVLTEEILFDSKQSDCKNLLILLTTFESFGFFGITPPRGKLVSVTTMINFSSYLLKTPNYSNNSIMLIEKIWSFDEFLLNSQSKMTKC